MFYCNIYFTATPPHICKKMGREYADYFCFHMHHVMPDVRDHLIRWHNMIGFNNFVLWMYANDAARAIHLILLQHLRYFVLHVQVA